METDSEPIEDEDIDGCIHSIHVRNFFCHDNLEINLNRNVNFIVGRNGSGKSAILTALVVGLGGRASTTNRGSNINSFIKKGANSATVEIKIKNNSAKAYRPNVYGDSITVIRHVTSSGGSSYKVKSSSGEVISTKFEEVNSIVLAHDIQVDNPISVLNQDDARSFHASDAKKKYSLFRKATNMDQTENNYTKALDNCNKAINIWNRKSEACLELEKEYKKWKTSYEQLQSRAEIELKKQSLQNEYYWSEITELEKEASLIQKTYDNQNARVVKLMEKLDKMQEHYGSNNEVIDGLKQQLDEKKLQRTALEQEVQEAESELRDVQGKWRAARGAVDKHAEMLKREQRKVADLEQEISNIESGSSTSRRAELESQADAARAAAEGSAARATTARHHAEQSRQHADNVQVGVDKCTQHVHLTRTNIKQLNQQLRELKSLGNDSLAVYGNNMAELCRRVKQAVDRGEFSAPPRGPVGAYLKLKEKKWGGALEHILGGSVQSFCVNSPQDSRKLFQIMEQVYGSNHKPSVTCSKFLSKRHDVSKNSVRARGYRSALDSIEVADPVVANYLIDNIHVESILLVPDHDDAMSLSDTTENVPRNCNKVVTLDCTEYHPAPNYRSYGGAARQPRFLHLSTAERNKQVQAEIDETEASLRPLEAKLEELVREASQARLEERRAAKELQALLADKHEKDEALRRCQTLLQQYEAPHHAVLVDELNVSKEKLQSLNKQIEEVKQREKRMKQKIDGLQTSIQTAKERLGDAGAACRNIHEQVEQEQLKLEQGVTERQSCAQKLQEDKSKLEKVAAILQEKQGVIDEKIQQAAQLCHRINNPRDKAIVTNELKKTQLKLSSIRNDGLSKAEVAEKLLQVERKYRRTKHTLDILKKLIDEVAGTTERHRHMCHQVQTGIARRVQLCFQSILTLRAYSGSMTIDNAKGTLEIACTGRESSALRRAASTSSLSGGERSYSTVAFIMALWECVELPFYLMDEFDVFMDNVNRKIVMELLIDHALKNRSRQFVFLTPQDASTVTANPHITIHRMADPRP